MKAHQRAALWKAIDLTVNVPLPHIGHGMKTASVMGAMRYANDMETARRMLRSIRDAAFDGADAKELNRELSEFVDWWESRERSDWS
jgi:hypothetical protein